MAATTTDPELEQTAWDLGALVDGEGETGVERRLAEALDALAGVRRALRGQARRARRRRPGARRCASWRAIHDLVGRAGTYAALRFSTDTADPARGALLQRVQEQGTAIETTLLFFELEWAALPRRARRGAARRARGWTSAATTCATCAATASTCCRARGEDPRREVAHRRERVVAAVRGADLRDRGRAARRRRRRPRRRGRGSSGSRSTSRSAASSLPDRELRRTTAEAVTAALAPGLRTRAFLFNTLLADKATDDRLRRYPHWLAARNLANEASDESVQALIEAVRGRYEIARRWYRLKAQPARRRAARRLRPHGVRHRGRGHLHVRAGARDRARLLLLVLTRAGRRSRSASSTSAASTRRVRPAKRGGAFCASAVPAVHPYVLLNYTSRRRDVLTLAHELGHGVHFALAARQGVFHQGTPLTLAETASVFGETIVFGRLLAEDATPASRLALLAENLEDTIATVFRQVAMNRFEDLVHTARRERGRAVGRALRRAVGREPGRAAGRLRRDHRGLPLVVVLHPALHRLPRLRLRLRLRPAARAVGLRALRAARRRVRAAATWSCSPPAARARPRSSARSSASTSPTRASGTSGLDLVERQLHEAEQAAEGALGGQA